MWDLWDLSKIQGLLSIWSHIVVSWQCVFSFRLWGFPGPHWSHKKTLISWRHQGIHKSRSVMVCQLTRFSQLKYGSDMVWSTKIPGMTWFRQLKYGSDVVWSTNTKTFGSDVVSATRPWLWRGLICKQKHSDAVWFTNSTTVTWFDLQTDFVSRGFWKPHHKLQVFKNLSFFPKS